MTNEIEKTAREDERKSTNKAAGHPAIKTSSHLATRTSNQPTSLKHGREGLEERGEQVRKIGRDEERSRERWRERKRGREEHRRRRRCRETKVGKGRQTMRKRESPN